MKPPKKIPALWRVASVKISRRMRPKFRIQRDHQELRPQHAGQRTVNPEVDYLLVVQPALLRVL